MLIFPWCIWLTAFEDRNGEEERTFWQAMSPPLAVSSTPRLLFMSFLDALFVTVITEWLAFVLPDMHAYVKSILWLKWGKSLLSQWWCDQIKHTNTNAIRENENLFAFFSSICHHKRLKWLVNEFLSSVPLNRETRSCTNRHEFALQSVIPVQPNDPIRYPASRC